MGFKKSRRNKDKETERYTCSGCGQGINNNTYHSNKMNGLCNKCFNADTREHTKRKISKKRDLEKKNRRKFKNAMYF